MYANLTDKRDYQKIYYERNKDRIKSYIKEWRNKNKDLVNKSGKEWRDKHRNLHRAACIEDYYKNRYKKLQQKKEYYRRPGIKKRILQQKKEYYRKPEVRYSKLQYQKYRYYKKWDEIQRKKKEYYLRQKIFRMFDK